MKRLLLLMLALCLLPLPALMEDMEIELPGTAAVWVNDTFYAINSQQEGPVDVMAVEPGGAPYVMCTVPGVRQDIMPSDYTDEQKMQAEQTINQLFDNDGKLYAINYFAGKAGPVDENGVHWTDTKLDMTGYFAGGNLMAYGSGFAQDGTYYVAVSNGDSADRFSSQHLLATKLSTGATRMLKPDGVQDYAPHGAGKLLVLRVVSDKDVWRWQMAQMDAASGELTGLPMDMPEAIPNQGTGLGGIGYDPATDTYFYATPQKLMLSKARAPFVLTALLPFEYMMPGAVRTFVLPDSQYALTQWGKAIVRRVGSEVNLDQSLTVQTGGGPMGIPDAFRASHPDAAVFTADTVHTAGEVGALIQGGDTDNDIFVLRVNPALRSLIQKGFAKALENEALLADYAAMYPAVQDALSAGTGAPHAWPVSFHWTTGYIQESAWKKYFGEEPYPTTFGELFDYMQRFADMEEGDDPEAYFLFAMEYESMVAMVVDAYIRQYARVDQALTFDRPALRDALDKLARANAIMAASGAAPQEFAGETSGDSRNAPSLVHPFSGGGGLFQVPYDFEEALADIPPFTFEKGETPVQRAHMDVMIINPRSRNPALAEAFIASWLDKATDPMLYYAIRPDVNEPYLNPDFEERLQRTRDDLALYTQKLKEAEKNNAPAHEMQVYAFRVQLAEEDLREQDRLKYMIPAEGIRRFRENAPLVAYDDRLLLMSDAAAEQLHTLRARYVAGELTLDGYLDAMTQVARLVFLESR